MPEPLVNDAHDWRHVIDRFFADSPAGLATYQLLAAAKKESHELIAPICLVWWITQFFDLAALKETFRIAILGCEHWDAAIDGRLYQLLPWLLARLLLKTQVYLVGPELKRPSRSKRLDRFGLERAVIERATCGAWWEKRASAEPLPDLFVIFHPGMESHARRWMKKAELPVLLKTGVPTAVFSYDMDEAARDATVFAAFGTSVIGEPCFCPLAVRSPFSDVPGGAVFSGAAFAIKGFEERSLDERIVESVVRLSSAVREAFDERQIMERHSDAFRACYVERDGKLCEALRVFEWIYFDPKREEFFVAQWGKEIPGCPVSHTPGFRGKLHETVTPLQRACLAASVYHLMRGRAL